MLHAFRSVPKFFTRYSVFTLYNARCVAFSYQPCGKEDVKAIMREYDKDDSGSIEYPEFRDIMREKMGERNPDDELAKAFKVFDDDSSVELYKIESLERAWFQPLSL
jgi:hypothetical protein